MDEEANNENILTLNSSNFIPTKTWIFLKIKNPEKKSQLKTNEFQNDLFSNFHNFDYFDFLLKSRRIKSREDEQKFERND